MNSLTTYFDAIYCINLRHRKDRWKNAKEEFKKIGIAKNVVRFNAVKRKNGAIGCLLSHRLIIEKAKKKWYKNILVFEDDVTFLKSNKKIINSIQKLSENKDWDLFYLWGLFHLQRWSYKKIIPHLWRVTWLWCTHAIAYNKSIFDLFITELGDKNYSTLLKKYKTYDNWLMKIQDEYVAIAPENIYATQKNMGSDIASSCWFDKWQTNMEYRWVLTKFQPTKLLLKTYSNIKKLLSNYNKWKKEI